MQTSLNQQLESYLDTLEKSLENLSETERAEWREEMRQHLTVLYDEARQLGISEEVAIQKAITKFGKAKSLQKLICEEQFAVRKTNYRHIFLGTLMALPFMGTASFYAEFLSVKYYIFFGFIPKSNIAILVYLLLLSCPSGFFHAISMQLSKKSPPTNKLSAFFSALAFSPILLFTVMLGKNATGALMLCIYFSLLMCVFIALFHKILPKFSKQTT
jgi:hypothetical protein